MKYSKMSDYIGQSEVNEYGVILDSSSIMKHLGVRVKMWHGIASLLSDIDDEWLPAPKDLAATVQEGVKMWMQYLDAGDQSTFHANPGLNYDYYVAQNGETMIGVLAVQYNHHPVFMHVLEEPAVRANELSKRADTLAYCATFYVRNDYRDGKTAKRLIDFAVTDLAEKGYKFLITDEMLDQADANKSTLYNLHFFLGEDWKEIGKIIPDKRRTDSKAFPHMKADRRKLEYGTVWLCRKLER